SPMSATAPASQPSRSADVATEPPTAVPDPTPSPSSPPAATDRPRGKSPFERVDQFDEDETVSAIVARPMGYVAVGWRSSADYEVSDGRVWTSADGLDWTRHTTEMPDGY